MTDIENSLTPAEALRLRQRLHSIGHHQFVEETILNGAYDARTLLTAFGVDPDYPYGDDWYIRLLNLCLQRELQRRHKLRDHNTIEDAVSLLQRSRNIVVITGAGISTSLGIPDFRSKNTGFYSQLLARGYTEPEEVFDIHTFDEDPSWVPCA